MTPTATTPSAATTNPEKPIDLRSDTLTRPTPSMREAMARAEVGDDVFGEDPTVNALQARAASLMGKEAALYVPSGSMANQIALLLHCRPGDDVVVSEGAHNMCYEVGAGGALAGVQFTVVGSDGLFTADEMAAGVKPSAYYYPRTRLVCIENTHNRSGGRVWPLPQLRAVADAARARGIAVHLDGARIFNAALASKTTAAEIAAPFHTVSFCLSKGLGAPVGSLLCGEREAITEAHRLRKRLGGGMRQAGILAAAGLHALEHHVERLAADHESARRFAEGMSGVPGVKVRAPETNIVMVDLLPSVPIDAEALAQRARKAGVLVIAMGPRRVRAVTHLDVSGDECARAASRLGDLLREL